MENVVICAVNREDIKEILKFISNDIQVIGYTLMSDINEEIYDWLDNFQINYDILKNRQKPMEQRLNAVNMLVKALLQDILKETYIPNISELMDRINEMLSSIGKENLEYEIQKVVNVFQNILENICSLYKLININNIKKLTLNELKEYDIDNIIIYNGNWPQWIEQKNNVFWFQRFLDFYWGMSPERYYLIERFKEEKKSEILGLVTGMSYTQRGINVKRLIKKTCHIGAPTQDLYYDYLMCKFAVEQCKNVEFCIIGIAPYSLWYDMSLSKKMNTRCLYYYEQTKSLHHLKNKEYFETIYQNQKIIYDKLFHHDIIKKVFYDYKTRYHLFEEDLTIYNEKNITEENINDIKKLSNKPYEATYLENVEILENFLIYLKTKQINPIIVIPPYPKIFIKNMSYDMLNRTIKVIENFKQTYNFTFLNFIGDKRFEDVYFSDSSHLNYFGSNLMADILNSVV